MKQNDWIIIGVCGVLSLGAAIYFITQAPQPQTPPKPTPVPTADVSIPKTPVTFQVGLPQPAGQQGGGGGSEGNFGGGGPGAKGPAMGSSGPAAPIKAGQSGT